jgi:hypothetical protein
MAWVAFHKWKQGQLDSNAQPGAPVDFDGASALEILLLTSAVDPASHVSSWDDVTAMLSTASVAEVTGSNYARKVLSGNDVTLSGGTVTVDASDPAAYSQHASGFSDARYAILTGADASDASTPVIAYYDFGANKGNVTGSLTLQFSASGIFTFA